MKTDYGTDLKDIAKFILGNCSMGCISDFDDETHLNFIIKDLEKAGEDLLYYLSDATENIKLENEAHDNKI